MTFTSLPARGQQRRPPAARWLARTAQLASWALQARALAGVMALAAGVAVGAPAAATAAAATPAPAEPLAPYRVTDTRGQVVTLTAVPRRIVSLLPSVTESVCALNACDRLVGVDRFSVEPPQVRSLPQLGGNYDPNIEAIVQLRPDVVLMTHAPAVQARLRDLGITVLVLDATNLAGVRQVLHTVDALLQQSRAPALLTDMDAALARIAAAARTQRAGTAAARVYIEVDASLYSAAPQSFLGEILQLLGADNIAPSHLGPFPRLSPEWVVRHDPDLILQTGGGTDAAPLLSRPGWARLRAVQANAICRLRPPDSTTAIRPGPRLPEAAAIVAACLHKALKPAP